MEIITEKELQAIARILIVQAQTLIMKEERRLSQEEITDFLARHSDVILFVKQHII